LPAILVVDDDPHILALMDITLRQAGFNTHLSQGGHEALRLINTTKLDLAILDVMMPAPDGWTLCERIRSESSLPVIIVTARASTADTIKGLHLGADDYVTKPFEPAELVARVKAVLRRFRIATDQEIEIGDVHLDARTNQATWAGRDVPLPPKEFVLLFELARYCGQTLLRDRLIEELWGVEFSGDERTLDVHIKRLRDKFPAEASPFRIRTIRGVGYRLETAP